MPGNESLSLHTENVHALLTIGGQSKLSPQKRGTVPSSILIAHIPCCGLLQKASSSLVFANRVWALSLLSSYQLPA